VFKFLNIKGAINVFTGNDENEVKELKESSEGPKLKKLLKEIECCDFALARKTLDASIEFIDRNFSNVEGQTIAHFAILSLINGVKKIWAPYTKNTYYMSVLQVPEMEQMDLLKEFYAFFDKLLAFNFPCNSKNKNGIPPIYLLKGLIVSWWNPKPLEIQRELIIRLEKNQSKVFEGRKYVSSLNLYRASKKPDKICEIPNKSLEMNKLDGLDMTLHQRLEILEQYFSAGVARNSSNLVFANLGLVVSASNSKEYNKRQFITTSIYDKERLVIRSTFNNKLCDYTHSEAGLCDCLCNEEFLNAQVAQLIIADRSYKKKVYAVVLDIYSSREMCLNCESILHKLQVERDERSFLKILAKILGQNDYELSEKEFLPLIIRVVGFDDPSSHGDQSAYYPTPLACERYNRNIKSYDPAVILHLTPKHKPLPKSNYVVYSSFEDEGHIKPLYQKRDIFFLKPQDKVTLRLQTAFSNSGVMLKSGEDKFTIVRDTQQDTITLSYYNLQNYTFHQISFKPDIEVAKFLLEELRLGKEAAKCILSYLYSIIDSDKEAVVEQEIDELLDSISGANRGEARLTMTDFPTNPEERGGLKRKALTT
jgi:hypothetical protein